MSPCSRLLSRRAFVRCLGGSAAAVAGPLFLPDSVWGANEQVRIGFIGAGRRASQLMVVLPDEIRVAGVCDCYLPRAEEFVWRHTYAKVPVYQDYRKMIEAEKLDGVIIANRAHQRVAPALHAMQAGLDVYAEKPLTLYFKEGRLLVTAARKYGRVFQTGTQSRSLPLNRWACDFLQRGGIGKIERVIAVNQPGPVPYPGGDEEPIPAGLDWDRWIDQAPMYPFTKALFRSPMRYRPFDGYDVGNWSHGPDMIQCALGKDTTGPVEVWPEPDYQGESYRRPVHIRYADGVVVSFTAPKGPNGGGIFHGSQCKLELNFNKITTNPPDFVKNAPAPLPQLSAHIGLWTTQPHLQNWAHCIKTRQQPNAPAEIGHRSMTLCHLINICKELNRKLRWDPDRETFPGDAEATALLDRPRRKGYELPEA